MSSNFLPILSKEQVNSLLRFLKKKARSKYSNDEDYMNHVLKRLDIFFEIRMNDFTSKYDALHVMRSIAKYFCFISDTDDFALCTWPELVLRTFLVVPSIRIVNKKRLCFRYKTTVFVVHPSYYIYGHRRNDREATFNVTIA